MATRELYLCVDAEVDGHVPGPYSMVSIGACAAAIRAEDASVEILDPDDQMFYAVLKPISDTYLEKALRVTGLDRAQLEQDGRPPGETMAQFATWVDDLASAHGAQPVLAAFPLGLVWQFTQHYLHEYAGRSPFGQSAHYDIKTAYATLAPSAVRDVIRRRMPSALLGPRCSKTGHALEDAKGFADLLAGLLTWQRSR
jgi:hypothetical protein